MKTKIFLSACAMFLIIGFATLYSQPGLGPCYRGQNPPAPYSDLPELSEEQRAGIESLRQQFREDMKNIRETSEYSKEEIREIFLLNRSALHQKIETLLTPAQLEVLKQKSVQFPNQMQSRNNRKLHSRFANEMDRRILMENRIEFEKILTIEEKELIAAMREKVDNHGEMMRSFKPGEITLEERKEIRAKHVESLQPLREIAQKYRAELSRITRDAGFASRPQCPRSDIKPGARRFHNQANFAQNDFVPGIRFILLEPVEKDSLQMDKRNDEMNIYPNPTAKDFTVEFDLMKPGNVTIELLNKRAELIGLLENTYRETGFNTFIYEGDLLTESGVYFIRVNTPEKMMIRKLVRH
jgi:hypothetical protein